VTRAIISEVESWELKIESQAKCAYNNAVRRHWPWLVSALLILSGIIGYWRYRQWRDHRFDPLILSASRRYGVEPALVKAVVWRESRFNPRARGKAGEFGLMQIREAAASEWAQAERLKSFAPEHLLDPATNTLAGTWYLRKLLARYQKTDSPIPYALADYNAGRSNVLRWNKGAAETNAVAFVGQMDYPGTRKYVRSVIGRYREYRTRFPETL
jgi:peptidoglycan lytic transglycosylase